MPARSLYAIGLISLIVPGVSHADSPQTTIQPSLAINYIVLTGASTSSADGDVDIFAGNFAPQGTVLANGSSLSTTTYPSTYANIGNTFGTSGSGAFDVPNLSGATPIGSGQGNGLTNRNPGDSVGVTSVTLTTSNTPTSLGGGGQSFTNMQPSLTLNDYVCVTSQGSGGDSTPMLGEIVISGGSTAPAGCVAANGAMLSTSTYSAYYAQVGTTFGSGGANQFAVPDLQGRAALGAGTNTGTNNRTPRTLGDSIGTETNTLTQADYPAPTGGSQHYSNIQPSLALHYIIALEGNYPSQGTGPTGAYTSNSAYLGQIVLYTGSTAPNGWQFCDGQTLTINQNQLLFSLFGTTYGGNGQTTFQLPNLDDNLAVGSSSSLALGGEEGVETLPTNANELPPAVPEPTCLFLLPLAALLARRRR